MAEVSDQASLEAETHIVDRAEGGGWEAVKWPKCVIKWLV